MELRLGGNSCGKEEAVSKSGDLESGKYLHEAYSVIDPLRNGFMGSNSVPIVNSLKPIHPVQELKSVATGTTNYYPTKGLTARAMGSVVEIQDALFAHAIATNVTSVGARSLALQSYSGALDDLDHDDWLAPSELYATGLGCSAIAARLDANIST